MKTLTINSLSRAKAFFMLANPATNSKRSFYQGRAAVNARGTLKQEDNTPAKKEHAANIGDIMRTAYRGNFSAGPTFLFHPGWFE